MTKKKQDVTLVAEPAAEDLFVISYKGYGFATRIGETSLKDLLKIAKKALEKQEKENGRGQEEGKEIRTEGEVIEG